MSGCHCDQLGNNKMTETKLTCVAEETDMAKLVGLWFRKRVVTAAKSPDLPSNGLIVVLEEKVLPVYLLLKFARVGSKILLFGFGGRRFKDGRGSSNSNYMLIISLGAR